MLIRKLLLSFAAIAMIAVIAILSWIGYLYLTYIDEVIVSSGGYGFSIGDSKLVSYKKIPKAFARLNTADSRVFVELEVKDEWAKFIAGRPGNHNMVETQLDENGFWLFNPNDTWTFYVGASYFNSITLTFCDDRLCRIYRHRKNFELP